jgi:hypothetical protein
MERSKSLYALACAYGDPYDYDMFFVTFNTKNEDEALSLASCIYGGKAEKCLVIINEHGDIFPL